MSLLVLLVAGLAIVLWVLREPLLAAHRRARIARQPFPAQWREILRRRVPYFRAMPADLQLQLKKRIQVLLAEKPFIGCAGLEVTDEMRVTIAAQAGLLILNRRTGYFPELRQVLVYPGGFLVDRVRTDGAGVQHSQRRALSGESWSQGQVILSWADAADDALAPHSGRNVVLHEFAHQLDQENGGAANGAPYLAGAARRSRWAQVMGREFDALRQRAQSGTPSLLDDYGATDPAEFFAVATEAFFEQPLRMRSEHPSLYGVLSDYYRVDPLSW